MLQFQNPDFEQLQAKEWLLTNGLGAYASGTLSGANTRRYHGLLIAAFTPPTNRHLLVAKIENSIRINRQCSLELSSNQYPGAIHPKGYQYLKSFRRTPLPSFTYEVDYCKVEKNIFMVHGSNTTIVEYYNVGDCIFELKLAPLFNYRDHHHLQHERSGFDLPVDISIPKQIAIRAFPEATTLFFRYSKGDFSFAPSWYRNFQYLREQDRGLDFQENHFCLGNLECLLLPGESVYLTFTTDKTILRKSPADLKKQELNRIEQLKENLPDNAFFRDLAVAADQMIVQRESTNHHSLIAGYPWFADWGRDTMISLPGICLATERSDIAKSVLRTFIHHLEQGLIPNCFPDQNEPITYNSVDATLWMFISLFYFYRKEKDLSFIKEIYPKLGQIILHFTQGTRFNIHLTKDKLLYAGAEDHQLTWMDAKVDNKVITPRQGCAVEVNALWYNALEIYRFFAKELNVLHTDQLANTCKELQQAMLPVFKQYFYNKKGYLNDVVIPGQKTDDTFRPNQIIATSLPFSILNKKQEKSVLEQVRERLYTPYGLRTLPIDHPDFKPRYEGAPWERDHAYHQGTVWPYLLYPYWKTYFKIYGNNKKTRAELKIALTQIKSHFYKEGCLHGISEIFDGQLTGIGKGCIQQAWSLAAILALLIEGGLVEKDRQISKKTSEVM